MSRMPRALVVCVLTVALLAVASPSPAAPEGAPGTPAAPTLTRSVGALTVAWVAPAGALPTGYRVEVGPGADGPFVPPPAGSCSAPLDAVTLTCQATGLVVGSSYVARVIATNDAGDSDPSPASPAVVFVNLPPAPEVTLVAGIASASLAWTPTGNGGSPITGYRVQVSRGSAGPYAAPVRGTCSGPLLIRACRITGLVEGATYYVQVRALTALGAGPWSSISAPARTLPRPDIRIAFGGDVHFEGAAYSQAGAGGLRTLPQIFAGADISMVNLETAIATGASSPIDKQYTFRAPARVLGTLAAAGVDVVTEANNHSIDYGASGLRTTLEARATSPIPVVGIGRTTADAIEPWVTEVRGTSVAVFGIVGLDLRQEENSYVARTWPATASTPGIAVWANHSAQILAAVKKWSRQVDVVVVYAHWGREMATCPNSAQRGAAELLAKAGATIIVGAHPHVLQGAGWMGRSVVAYSLGNFAWYAYPGRPSAALIVRVRHGKPDSYVWRPTTYTGSGLPVLVSGYAEADTRALLAERSAPGCSGLTATRAGVLPQSLPPCTTSLRPSEAMRIPGFE